MSTLPDHVVVRLCAKREELQTQVEEITAILEGRNDPVAYPEVVVPLTGEDGNALSITGRVIRAMKDAGIDTIEQDAYRDQALGGDYKHLLRVTMEWVHTY